LKAEEAVVGLAIGIPGIFELVAHPIEGRLCCLAIWMDKAMAAKTYAVSATMALLGTALAVFGQNEYKSSSIGLVLILGSFVFAVLYLGTRRNPPRDENLPETSEAGQ
jgi:hypothetical protein